MFDREDSIKAQRIFEHIQQTFIEQSITPSPLNYLVWYEYFKGEKPQFRQEMDKILNDPFGYNDRVGQRLFDEYIKVRAPETNLDAAFKRLLDALMRQITHWTENLEDRQKELNSIAGELNKPNLDSETLKTITSTMLNTNASMQQDQEHFASALSAAQGEIRELRHQLNQARKEAMQDELTQLSNRRAFVQELEEAMDDFITNPQNLHIIITDIDHFKKINDNFGHLVGDSILRYFANLMKKHSKPGQLIARYGGEEFVILLPHTTLEEAIKQANSMRDALSKVALKRKDTQENLPPITASFGIAEYRKGDTAKTLVERADQYLYQAKETGRNKVIAEILD